jgi:hypothetical protein
VSVFVTVLRDYTVTVCQMYPLFVYGTLKRSVPLFLGVEFSDLPGHYFVLFHLQGLPKLRFDERSTFCWRVSNER